MIDFENLKTFFEGDSRLLKETDDPDVLIAKLKPTIFSIAAQGPILLPGIDHVRVELNKLFCDLLHEEDILTSTLKTQDGFIFMSKEEVAPIEVVVKSSLVGSPKHVYKNITTIPTRLGHALVKGAPHEPYVRFDWRNPLPESDHCMPEGLADYFIDTAQAKTTALKAFKVLKKQLNLVDFDLIDICFFMNKQGKVICGEVTTDNSQIVYVGSDSELKKLFNEKGKESMLAKAQSILEKMSEKKLTADVIVGGYLGDEGKGKLVGGIGKNYDAIFRVNASTNAGHSVSDGINTYVTRQLPSVFFSPSTELVVAPGALLNLIALEEEVRGRPDISMIRGQLKVATSVSLVIDPYLIKDRGTLGTKLGSTRQGTGPSAAARAERHSLRLFDIKKAATDRGFYDVILEKVKATCQETLPGHFSHDSAYFKEVLDSEIQAYQKIEEMVGDFTIDYTSFLAQSKGKKILIEGCNGLLLDNLHGLHPYVTSASTNIGALMCGANLSPDHINRIIVVIAAYATCLGVRAFPTEMDEKTAEHFFANCNEVDVAEFKKRRIGWIDIPALRKALVGSRGAILHVNKLDVLTGIPNVRICTHYTVGDSRYDILPDDPFIHPSLKAHYIEVDGWCEPLQDVRDFAKLPENARRYIKLLQNLLPNPIATLGVGPRNEDLIEVRP